MTLIDYAGMMVIGLSTDGFPSRQDGWLLKYTDTGEQYIHRSGFWESLGSGLQGPQGIQGNDGQQGIQGIQGIPGDTGPRGDNGYPGEQGIQGDPGFPGAKGDAGDAGLQGEQGIQGIQGNPGIDGQQGDPGTPGAKGDTGDQGIQGEPGTPGTNPVWGLITGTLSSQTDLNSALNGKEPANANIQTHVTSAHAPSNAQKNSDITKAEIEAKLTGEIVTHTHAGGGGADPFLAKLRLAGDITNATVTPAVLTGMVFNFLANSFYIFDMYMLCTSVAATTGYGFAVDVSAAVTNIALSFSHQLATGGTRTGGDSIADNVSRGLSTGVPAITVVNFVMGKGILMTGANPGTAQFTFRPEVAASATCKAGSIITVMKIS